MKHLSGFLKRFKWYRILVAKMMIRNLDRQIKSASNDREYFLQLTRNNLSAYVAALEWRP